MADICIRGMTRDRNIRFFAIDATESVQKSVEIHNLSITASVVMGRLLAAVGMIGLELKSETDKVTLKIVSDGPLGNIITTADNAGHVKGYIQHPQTELPRTANGIDVKGALGNGYLQIIKDLGMKEPYMGQIELIYKEIAQDLTYYYAKSEQIPSSVGLGVLIEPDGSIREAGGFMVQIMPDTPDEVVSKVEKNLKRFPNLTDIMDMGYDIETIVDEFILKDMGIDIKARKPIQYYCDCSYEKFSVGVGMLETEEIEKSIESGESITAHCHFCNKDYTYEPEKLKQILEEIKKNTGGKDE